MAGQDVEFLMFDVGLGLRLLMPRTLSPDSGRGADAECKGVQGGVRGNGPTTSGMRGTSKGARGGRFFSRLRPRRGYGAGCEGSNVRKKTCYELSLR